VVFAVVSEDNVEVMKVPACSTEDKDALHDTPP
jgi:hypothetical protein